MLFMLFIVYSCRKEGIEPNSPFVWITGDRTLVKSPDAGSSWENYFSSRNFNVPGELGVLPPNQVIRNISFCNTLTGVLCGDYGFFAFTKDSKTWKGGVGYDFTNYKAVIFDTATSFICSELITYSNGNPVVTQYYGLDFIDKSTGWMVGDNSRVMYTTDSTKHFTPQTTAPGNIYNEVKTRLLSDSKYEVWIAGNRGVIFKTTDSGQNWQNVPSGVTEDLTSICFTDNGNVFITGQGGLIMKTSDSGNSFLKLNTGTMEKLNSISFMDNETGIAVGDYGTYIKTTDGGDTWSLEQWDKTKNLYCVTFVKRFWKK